MAHQVSNSIQQITRWFAENGIEYTVPFHYGNKQITRINLKLNDDVIINIETDSVIVGNNFAGTNLMDMYNEIICVDTLKYSDEIKCHRKIQDLICEIINLLNYVKDIEMPLE